jgi:hypothetical protein
VLKCLFWRSFKSVIPAYESKTDNWIERLDQERDSTCDTRLNGWIWYFEQKNTANQKRSIFI